MAHEAWGGLGDRQFIQLGGRIGRVLTDPVGPGFLKGHFEASLELLPLFLMFQEETAFAGSVALLVRHHLAPASRLRPFVSFGAGVLFSSKDIPPGSSRVNFSPQIGGGLVYPSRQRTVLFFEYRLHHISNAQVAEFNPGINSSYYQFGVSFFR